MLRLVPLTERDLREVGDGIHSPPKRQGPLSSPVPLAPATAKPTNSTWRSGRFTFDQPRPAPKPRRVPDHRERIAGWGKLVAEIDESTKRTRVAKGGYYSHKDKEKDKDAAPVSTAARPHNCEAAVGTAPATAAAVNVDGQKDKDVAEERAFDSYHVDEEEVPDSVLDAIWRRALDPKHSPKDALQSLPRLPRLTVTDREVEQLPQVHDLLHWRDIKKKRKEAKMMDEAGDCYPTLREMMAIIFGEEAAAAAVQPPFAASARSATPPASRGSNADHEQADAQVVVTTTALSQRKGVLQRGRRNAFDEGQPQSAGRSNTNATLCELEADQRRPKESLLMRKLRAAQAEDHDDAALEVLSAASHKVSARSQRRLDRLRRRFLLKQGSLSARLQMRVLRIQEDAEQLREAKVSSILPSAVTKEAIAAAAPHSARRTERESGAAAATAAAATSQPTTPTSVPHTVLHFLNRHRRLAERERRRRDSVYLDQVENFQTYLRLIADPNRPPERGELYLSDCFRHVLAAGFVVNEAYFFRVLAKLEREDFERAPTVNLIAVCCSAFRIDLRSYCQFLIENGLPTHSLRSRPDRVKSWEDWAPWNGMELARDALVSLVEARPSSAQGGTTELHPSNTAIATAAEDPMPFFRPVLPEEMPTSSEPVSREEDPLMQILGEVALDAVLERYAIFPRKDTGRSSPFRAGGSGEGGRQRQQQAATDGPTDVSMAVAETTVSDALARTSASPGEHRVRTPRHPRSPPIKQQQHQQQPSPFAVWHQQRKEREAAEHAGEPRATW